MGDVVTALGRAVQEQGHSVTAMLPKYDCLDYSQVCTGCILHLQLYACNIVRSPAGLHGMPPVALDATLQAPRNAVRHLAMCYADTYQALAMPAFFCLNFYALSVKLP